MAGCAWLGDAGGCTTKGDSASGTDSFARVPTGAARRVQPVVEIVNSLIYTATGRSKAASNSSYRGAIVVVSNVPRAQSIVFRPSPVM
jgi:hypothetical protein